MNENLVPSEEILLKYASGSLEPGVRMLVDAHFERVPGSRERLAPFERLSSDWLKRAPQAALNSDALTRTLAVIDRDDPDVASRLDEAEKPTELKHGAWRWAGPGARVARVVAPQARTKLFIMRIARGRAMPEHGHLGREFTVVLEGAYRDESGLVKKGAFVEQTPKDRHKPVVTNDGDCVCLFALEAPIVARGLAGVGARWAMR